MPASERKMEDLLEKLPKALRNMDVSRQEVEQISKAFADEEFHEIFQEYCLELGKPEINAAYLQENAEMEKANGVHAEFIHPHPVHSLQLEIMPPEVSTLHTAYLNIAQNKMVAQSKCERDKDGNRGLLWHLPHTISPPREDFYDGKSGLKFRIYDVVFHPDTIRMGKTNSNFMTMLHKSAIDAVSSNFKVKVSPKYEQVMDRSYVGKEETCVLTTPLPAPEATKTPRPSSRGKPSKLNPKKEEEIREDLQKFMENRPGRTKGKVVTKSTLRTRWDGKAGVNDDGTLSPRWQIKQSKKMDLTDFISSPQYPDSDKKDDLVVSIWLPDLNSAKNVKIDIAEKTLTLETTNEPKLYCAKISLPYNVDSKVGKAVFRNAEQILEIKLPIAMNKLSFDDAVNNIEPPEIPDDSSEKRGPRLDLTEKELEEEIRRISNQPHCSLAELIPAHNLFLPDFKASESERWCLFEINVSEVPFDMENDCEITENGFHLANKFDPAIENIGLNVTIGNGGVKIDECHKYTHRQFAPGKRVLEVKLRKKNDGLLKHFNMGKTRNSLDSYRFDALISDRQVEGDRSLPQQNEPAVWLPTSKAGTPIKERAVLKANRGKKKNYRW